MELPLQPILLRLANLTLSSKKKHCQRKLHSTGTLRTNFLLALPDLGRLSGDYNPLHVCLIVWITQIAFSQNVVRSFLNLRLLVASRSRSSTVPYLVSVDARSESDIIFLRSHSGLCFMGISAKHILKTYGEWKDIKVRSVSRTISGLASSKCRIHP